MVTQFPSVRPEEITLKLEIKVAVSTQDDKEYFVLPSGEIQPGFLADCFDMLDMIRQQIQTINGKTYSEYHKILQGNATL